MGTSCQHHVSEHYPAVSCSACSGGRHFCGASIISNKWLVTAAHCIGSKTASQVQVVTGMHDKDTKRYGSPKEYSVKRIIVHSGWDRESLSNDITLLQINGQMEWSDY